MCMDKEMSYAGVMLYCQHRDEMERLKPKKTELHEPVPSKEEVLEQVDHIVLMFKDALDVVTLHRRELMFEDVVMRLKTLQKGLHALLEEREEGERNGKEV